MSIIPASLSLLSCHTLGLILYSVYYHCDPVLNKEQTGIKRYDQIIPAFIVNKFSSIPGMTGICIAGIFSASLSTISSCLNSASTVTVLDFIKPLYERKRGVISDRKVVWMVKILSVVYGGASVGLSFCFLEVRSLVQLMNVFISSLEGPVLAVFLTGVLTRKGDDKSVSVALVVGYSLMTWLGFGAIHSKYLEPSLPLTTDMCPLVNVTNTEMNGTITLLQTPKLTTDTFILYKISYMWICFIGYVLTQILICFAIVVTGWKNNVIPENSVCLSPVTRFWMKKKFLNESKEIKNEFEQEDSIVLSSRQ
nr:putative sodium-dependent multivitamin transporter [Parasteatoda tepidariorum]